MEENRRLWITFSLLVATLSVIVGCSRQHDQPEGTNLPPPLDLSEMVLIPGASFGMGCPSIHDRRCDKYFRQTRVDSFYLDILEVSQADFQRCIDAGVCRSIPPDCRRYAAPSRSPAQCLTWDNAKTYCEWLGKRLPTSAEWELAARGPDGGHDYPWGNKWHEDWANWCDGRDCDGSIDGYAGAAPIDAFPRNVSPYGVRNMAGNVVEWTSTLSTIKPNMYILRGGCYRPNNGMAQPTDGLLSWREIGDPPERNADHMGVRCAKTP